MILVSIVVPLYSGERYLARLVDQIETLRDSFAQAEAPISIEEVIFVNDNAIDNSEKMVRQLSADKPWIVLLNLSRNFGQHPATIAGILHSSGDWVVTIDEDLQHPPGLIPDLLKKAVDSEADIVYARSDKPVHESVYRDFTSRLFKTLLAFLSGNPVLRSVSSFRLIRGSVARASSSTCGHDTYFDVALSWFTARIEVISLGLKDERFIKSGTSNYNFRSLLSHAKRLIFSEQIKVFRMGAFLGFTVVGLSIIGAMILLTLKFLHPESIQVAGWTSIILTQAFFGGFALLLLGICIEYLSILVVRAHGKPLFFTINRSSDEELQKYFQSQEAR